MAEEIAKDEELQTIAGTQFVKNRIHSAPQALNICTRTKNNNKDLAVTRSRLKAMYDGNAPLPSSALKRRGLGWMSNLDWGECRSIIRANATAIWNMFFAPENLISLSVKKRDRDQLIDYGSVVAQAFSKAIRRWDDFYYEVNRKISDMSLYGYGITIHPDPDSFNIRTLPAAAVLIPSKQSMIPGKMDIIPIRDEIPLHELIRNISIIEDAGVVEESGWNTDYVRKKIIDKVQKGQTGREDPYGTSSWESALQILKNGDPELELDFDGIKVVHLYVKELEPNKDGFSVSHYIVYEGDDIESAQFMYEADREYKTMAGALNFLFFDIGNDALIKSVRGMGKEVYPFCEASNRLLNGLMNGVVQATGMTVTAKSQSAVEKFGVARKGNVTILPFDVVPLQQQMLPSIGPALEARSVFKTVQASNIGGSVSSAEIPGSKVKSSAEVSYDARKEASFDSNQAEWYYIQHQAFIKEIFVRMLDNKLDESDPLYEIQSGFFAALDEDDVPASLRNSDAWNISVAKAIGLGNPQVWRSITNEMMRMSGGLDEYGRHLVKRQWWAARVGWEEVNDIVPPYTRDNIPTFQHSIAEGEQVDMMSGSPRTVSMDDNPVIHMNMHYQFANGLYAQMQELQKGGQGNPVALFTTLKLLSEHNETHIAYMTQDEGAKGKVEAYQQQQEALLQAVSVAEQLAKQFVKRQQEAQKEQQKKIAELQKKAESHEVEMQKEKNRHAEAMKDAENLHEARMSKVETSNAAAMEKLKADLTSKYAMLEAELEKIEASIRTERLED